MSVTYLTRRGTLWNSVGLFSPFPSKWTNRVTLLWSQGSVEVLHCMLDLHLDLKAPLLPHERDENPKNEGKGTMTSGFLLVPVSKAHPSLQSERRPIGPVYSPEPIRFRLTCMRF